MINIPSLYYKIDYKIDSKLFVKSIIDFLVDESRKKYPNLTNKQLVKNILNEKRFDKDDIFDKFGITDAIDLVTDYVDKDIKKNIQASKDNGILFVQKKCCYIISTQCDSELLAKTDITIKFLCNKITKYLKKDISIIEKLLNAFPSSFFSRMIVTKIRCTPINSIAYNAKDIDCNIFDKQLIDKEDYSINKIKLSSVIKMQIKKIGDVYEIYIKNHKLIGLLIGNKYLPLSSDHLEIKARAFFNDVRLFKHILSSNNKREETSKNQKFLDEAFKEDFMNLLSKLTLNLYLPYDETINNKEYKKFFREVYILNNLNSLNDFVYFVNSDKNNVKEVQDEKILLGIYTQKKINNDYNLLHWIYIDLPNKKCQDYRNTNLPTQLQICKVWALNEKCSFYFIDKFYEDYIDKLLDNANIKYLPNTTFAKGKNIIRENDVIIFSRKKIYMVECKTRLNKNNIDETIAKNEILLQELKNVVNIKNIKFLMISPFYNKNIRDLFSTSIKESENSSDLDFKITLPSRKIMRCIVSQSSETMKRKLQAL